MKKVGPIGKYYEPLRREMMKPIADQLRQQQSLAMALKLDNSIREIADKLLPGWKIEDLAKRFSFVSPPGINVYETLCFDGAPVAVFGPMTVKTEQRGESWVTTVERSVRKLI